jgi:Bacterial Ig domain/Calx-beta domain
VRHSVITILLLSLLVAPARGQSGPQLKQGVVAGGGGVSAQGSLRVEGTVGQGVVATSTGGAFTLEGGFDLTFQAVNAQPTADGQSVTTDENTYVNITLTGSDEETPAGDLVFTVTAQPTHGSLGGSAPTLTYTPTGGYVGPDSFKFTVTDTGDGTAPPLTSAEATVSINVVRLPAVSARDARVAEPSSGQAQMLFTLTLDRSLNSPVSVNFETDAGTPGPGTATAGSDYTTVNGTATFQTGQTVQTVSVPVLSDGAAGEPDETFLLRLSNVSGGHIDDDEATGTITTNNPAGAILISEIRTFGPAGATQAGDDFVEIYNNTGAAHTVADGSGILDSAHGYGLFRMGATCADTPVLVGVIPNGTVIPARGHYLFVGSQYSLTTSAAGDQVMSSDLPENANVGIFKTPSAANLSTATRLDAVGFSPNTTGNNCDLLREGGALPQVISGTAGLGQHSFYRSLCSFVNGVGCTVANPGFPEDRNSNATDFLFVDTAMTNAAGAGQQRLGAPGPEDFGSERVNDQVGVFMLDASKSSSAAPNRVRKQCTDPTVEECLPNRSNLGTMSIRRRFINNTTGTITQLRVRVAELTTFPRLNAATADVRPITSTDVTVGGINDSNTCGAAPLPCTVTVKGTTVQAPTQANGGGYNTTMIVTLPGGGLPAGQSISLQFMLGVQESGSFRFLINVEALP